MGLGPQNIETLARRIQAAVEEAYAAAGVTPPAKRFIAAGEVPDGECEFLAVRFLRIVNGMPSTQSPGPEVCQGPRTAVFHVTVSRCAAGVADGAGGLIVDDEDLFEETADVVMKDAWCCHMGLARVIKDFDEENLDPDMTLIGPTQMLGPFSDRIRSDTPVHVWLAVQGAGS